MNNSIINNFVDSFIAFLFAISGPVAIMLSITSANNIDPRDVSIWLFGCFAVNGFFSIILTLKNKQPLVLMWSIPGMILIGYSLKNYSLNEIVGVYLTSSFLLFLISFTNIINFLKKNIPTEIVMGMVSAIFLSFCVDWINSLNTYPMLASIMSLTFFILLFLSKKIKTIPPLLGCLISGLLVMYFTHKINISTKEISLINIYLTMPEFNLKPIIELTIPLIITVIFIQNGQGIVLLENKKYTPPLNQITYYCGLGSFFNAYLGAVSTCLTGPVTGILTSNPNTQNQYISAILFSFLCIVFGLYSPFVLNLLQELPKEFIITLGGLALLNVLQQSFVDSFKSKYALSALLTFLVTLSEFSLFNIGAPFWGLLLGFLVSKFIEK